MAESALRQLVPQSAEPFVRSYNPFNPAFRETIRATASDLLGGRAIGGTPSQRYRAQLADLLTGSVDFAPGVSDAVAVSDTVQAARGGDYGTAAILGGATMLGMVPVIGDSASRAIREGLDMSTAGKAVRGGAPSAIRSVSQVVEDAVKSIPGLKLDVYGTPERGYTISRIEVPKDLRNTGLGTSVIRSITQAADQEGARLMLSPTSAFGGNKNRLEKFYRRLGFTRNSGRAKDFTTMETMIRPPSVASGIAGNALDMSQAARMQRADAMEYLPETVYHGTAADIESFRPATYGSSVTKARSAKMGAWFSDNPEVSAGYARFAAEDVPVQRLIDKADEAGRDGNFDLQEKLYLEAEQLELGRSLQDGGGQNIIPARIRGKMFEVDAEGATMSDLDDSQLYQWAQEAKSKGYDGLKIKNFSDNADYGKYLPATHYLVFDPANIRSVNAAFDPAKRNSANLMAGVGGAAVGLSALNQLVPRNEERQPD